jgi:hypothetical protein
MNAIAARHAKGLAAELKAALGITCEAFSDGEDIIKPKKWKRRKKGK